MKIVSIVLLSSFLFAFQNLSAQETWSLEKCIKHALENNLQIKQQKVQQEINQNQYKQSKRDVLPGVSASLGQNINLGRNIDYATNTYINQTSYSTSVGIGASADLFKGFANYHQIKKNEYSFLSANLDLEKIKNNIQVNIVSAYLQILFNEELVKVSKTQIETTNLQIQRTKILVDAGKLPKGNLLEIQAQLAQEELQLVNHSNNLESSYLNLTQLLELESSENFKIVIPEIAMEANIKKLSGVNESYQLALDVLPDVKSSKYMLEASKTDLEIAKSYYYPTLSMSVGYNTGYSSTFKDPATLITKPFFEQFSDNYGAYLSFSLRIPIFNKFQVKNNVNNSKLRIQQSEFNLENTKKALYKEIQQAFADASAALKKYYATKKAVESYEESFRYTQEKFNTGLLNSIEYNMSKNQLTNAQSELLRAKYEYVFKSNILDFYRGNPFSF